MAAAGRRDGASAIERSIDSYLDHLAIERGLAQRSVEAYGRDLSAFARGLVARRVRNPTAIRADDVRAHLVALEGRGLAARSQARALAAVRSYLRWVAREHRLAEDPTAHIRLRRPPGRLPRSLGHGEVGRIVTVTVPGGRRPQRDRALLELLYACGLRVSEATALPVHALNLEAGFVTVLGKGNKERVVPLGQHAREAILEYLAGERPTLLRGRNAPHLFVRAGGRPISRQTVWKLVRDPRAGRRGGERRVAAHAAAHVRHPSPGRRRRPARGPGAPRPRRHRHHADLHPRRAGAAARRASPPPPAGLRPGFLAPPGAGRIDCVRMEPSAMLARIAIVAVPLLVAVVFHEVAHGVVAYACGDPTAARAGRLTLNPLRHVDPVGTVLLPGFLLVTSLVHGHEAVLLRLGQAGTHRPALVPPRTPRLDPGRAGRARGRTSCWRP